MATRHSIEERTEDAVKAYLQANLGGSAAAELPVTLSFEGTAEDGGLDEDAQEELSAEGIRISSPQAQEFPETSGDYEVTVDVAVTSLVQSTTRAEHAELVGAVMDLLYNTELITNMATAAAAAGVANWRCMKVTRNQRSRDRRGSQRITIQRLTLLVMPS